MATNTFYQLHIMASTILTYYSKVEQQHISLTNDTLHLASPRHVSLVANHKGQWQKGNKYCPLFGLDEPEK